MTLGIGVGVDITDTLPNRRNTLSPFDFAYWTTTFIADGKPADYSDIGPTGGTPDLIVWALSQVGVDILSSYENIDAYCSETRITVSEALAKRGALLFNGSEIAVTLGLTDILTSISGRYFIKKVSSSELSDWNYGALIPRLEYK
jgi:hypothetical protein